MEFNQLFTMIFLQDNFYKKTLTKDNIQNTNTK